MDDLAKLPVEDFLERVADRTPTPGGGSVTALAGALACALARMVSAFSATRKGEAEGKSEVATLNEELAKAQRVMAELVTVDAEAYEGLTAAARRARQDAAAAEAYQSALRAGAAVPMQMAAVASNALAVMNELKDSASRYLLSDLGIAALLAEATARAARYTVEVNARQLQDADQQKKLLSDVDEVLRHCTAHRESVETFVRSRLEGAASTGR